MLVFCLKTNFLSTLFHNEMTHIKVYIPHLFIIPTPYLGKSIMFLLCDETLHLEHYDMIVGFETKKWQEHLVLNALIKYQISPIQK